MRARGLKYRTSLRSSPSLTIGSFLCCQGKTSQHLATGGCVCDPQGILHLPGAVSVGLGVPGFLCPQQPGKVPVGSQVPQPAPWCRQPAQVILPYPRYCPRRAQGLVSLRATGREVFDWILDQGYYSERDTSNVVRQVLEAVAYLHSLKIVHRNLKVRLEGQLVAGLGQGGQYSRSFPHGIFFCPSTLPFLAGTAGEPGLLQPAEEFKDCHQRLPPG